MRYQLRIRLLLPLAILLLVWPLAAHGQERAQRLILKDGSAQRVVKFEVQGDRVHYLSAERFEWEDVPAELVDWDATKKYNEELSSGKLRTHTETPSEREEREKEEANSPEIAPGLHLPDSGGVFLFDQYGGKPELAEIVQNGSDLEKASRKKNVLRAAINPLAASKQAFQIKGEHAAIQSHVPRPTIYLDIDLGPQTDAGVDQRFRIVRATAKNGLRVLGDIKVKVTGKTSEEINFVPATLEKIGMGAWLKIIPMQDLAPGEYAIVEMLGPQEMNLYVWDFGVNPKAPANPNTWRPLP